MDLNQKKAHKTPRKPSPHERLWNGRCVDKDLKDEWLLALNSFKTFNTVSICQGHMDRDNDLSCPHINLKIKPEYIVKLKEAMDNPKITGHLAQFPKDTDWDYEYCEERSNEQPEIKKEIIFRFMRIQKQTSSSMNKSTEKWFEKMIQSLLLLDQLFSDVLL
jgi:hypothetical protein